MPTLAIRNQDDVKRLRQQVRTQFEADLLETLVSWRFRYEKVFEVIKYASEQGLNDSRET
jgi:hypothetical protein